MDKFKSKINDSKVLINLGLEKENYFVVSIHREENIDLNNNFENICNTLNFIAEKYKKTIIFFRQIREYFKNTSSKIKFNKLIKNITFLGFFNYVHLKKIHLWFYQIVVLLDHLLF